MPASIVLALTGAMLFAVSAALQQRAARRGAQLAGDGRRLLGLLRHKRLPDQTHGKRNKNRLTKIQHRPVFPEDVRSIQSAYSTDGYSADTLHRKLRMAQRHSGKFRLYRPLFIFAD